MSTVLRGESFPDETENHEAFELMTEALELLDRYEALAEPLKGGDRHERSYKESLLRQAEDTLSKVLKIEGTYLKARYFLAITRYLRKDPDSAIKEFDAMLDMEPVGSFADEIRYNRAAAYSEAGDFGTAIKEFTEIIERGKARTEIKLLARAARTLTRAGRISKGGVDDVKGETRKVEDDYHGVRKELRFNFIRRLLRGGGRVDGKVAEQIKEVLTAARVEIGMPSRRWLTWLIWIFIVSVVLFIIVSLFYYLIEYRIVHKR